MAKPCRGCGGPKPKGRGRTYCLNCNVSCDVHEYYTNKCNDCNRLYARSKNYQDESYNEKRRAKRYGLTVESMNELLAIGKCEVCGRSDVKFCIDHDHETGKVRGLLCDYCNKALGMAQDSPEILRKLARYLDDRT